VGGQRQSEYAKEHLEGQIGTVVIVERRGTIDEVVEVSLVAVAVEGVHVTG